MKLWEIQGSFWHVNAEMNKGGYRQNRRSFVITDTAEHAMTLWHATCAGTEAEIHQVICRTNASTDLITDNRPQGATK